MTAAGGVVGQAAVEGLGQVGGGEVADLVPGVDGGDAEGDQDMALARAGRPDQAQILPGGDPFQRGEVVQGRAGDRARCAVQLVEGLDHGERRCFHPGPGVGGVAGGDLGVDQGAQQFLGCPPLGLRGDQQLGGELPDSGQLEPAQPGGDVGGQRRRGGGHDSAADGVVGQRADRDGGQVQDQRVTGRDPGLGQAGAGGQDRPDVGGPPPAERDRPVQRGEELLVAVGGAQRVQLGQVGAEPGAARPRRRR